MRNRTVGVQETQARHGLASRGKGAERARDSAYEFERFLATEITERTRVEGAAWNRAAEDKRVEFGLTRSWRIANGENRQRCVGCHTANG